MQYISLTSILESHAFLRRFKGAQLFPMMPCTRLLTSQIDSGMFPPRPRSAGWQYGMEVEWGLTKFDWLNELWKDLKVIYMPEKNTIKVVYKLGYVTEITQSYQPMVKVPVNSCTQHTGWKDQGFDWEVSTLVVHLNGWFPLRNSSDDTNLLHQPSIEILTIVSMVLHERHRVVLCHVNQA